MCKPKTEYGMIKAFTIVEAVVSMVVTAIIFSVIFVIFSIVSERLSDFKKQNEYVADLNRWSYSVNKAIFESNRMSLDEKSLSFVTYNGEIITYEFQDEKIVRQSGAFRDTFNMAVQRVHIDTLRSPMGYTIYQRLQCQIAEGEVLTKMNFYKKIYANQLIEVKGNYEF